MCSSIDKPDQLPDYFLFGCEYIIISRKTETQLQKQQNNSIHDNF